MLRFIHKGQALPANTHYIVMNLSFKKLHKFNNEANTEKLKGKKSYISLFHQQMLIRVTILTSEQV